MGAKPTQGQDEEAHKEYQREHRSVASADDGANDGKETAKGDGCPDGSFIVDRLHDGSPCGSMVVVSV